MRLPFAKPRQRAIPEAVWQQVRADVLSAVEIVDTAQSDIELALMMLAAGQTGQAFDVLVHGYARLAGVDAAAVFYLQAHRDGIALVGRAA